jgi:hypothetical protein
MSVQGQQKGSGAKGITQGLCCDGIPAGRGRASPEATLRAAPVRAASAARERPATRVPRRRGDATSPPDRSWLPLDGLSPLCTATARRGRNLHLAPLNYSC